MGSLTKPTTKVKRYPGAGGAGVSITFWKDRNAQNDGWIDRSFVKRRNPANDGWIWEFSKPTGTLSGGGANAASGAGGSGHAQSVAVATPGGVNSGNLSYNWVKTSGANNSYLGGATNTLTGYYDFSGVANAATGSVVAETVVCDITDIDTGAVYRTDPISMGPYSWTNTTPAFVPSTVTRTAGSGNENVPTGASHLKLTIVGGGGGGGSGRGASDPGGGGGGGSGDIEIININIAAGDYGAPIFWSIGAGSTSIGGTTTSTGTLTNGSVSASAPGGGRGSNGNGGGAGGIGGAPNGNNGHDGGVGGAAPGGAGGTGPDGAGGGGAGGGASGSQPGVSGSNGEAKFEWT